MPGVAGGAHDLPVCVPQPQDLAVGECHVHGAGGDGLVEVFGLIATRYDKMVYVFRGTVTVASLRLRLRLWLWLWLRT